MKKPLESLDLLIFLAVVLCCGWALISGMGTGRSARDTAMANADSARQALTRKMSDNRFESTGEAAMLRSLGDAVSAVRQRWEPKTPDREHPAGVFYHQESLEDLREGRDPVVRFPPPREIEGSADVGQIKLQWVVDEVTSVEVSGFVVYRRSGDASSVVVAKPGPFETEFVDTRVAPGQLYTYRVTARTREPLLVREGVEGESDQSEAVHVRGRKDYEISIHAFDEKTGLVQMKVRKFSMGTWHEKVFPVAEKQTIGGGDDVGVNFETRCSVTGIEFTRDTLEETRSEVVFLADGSVKLESGRPVTRDVVYSYFAQTVTVKWTSEVGKNESMTATRR